VENPLVASGIVFPRLVQASLIWLLSATWAMADHTAYRPHTLLELVNLAPSRDRYDPAVTSGLLVPRLQFGSGTRYAFEEFTTFKTRYYWQADRAWLVTTPGFTAKDLGIGPEFRLGAKGIFDQTWAGFQLQPAGPGLKPFVRGVIKTGRRSQIHLLAKLKLAENQRLVTTQVGYHMYPFRSSPNTFFDIKSRLIFDKRDIGPDELERDGMAMAWSVELGHGWAPFARIRGLELYGAFGLGYSTIDYQTKNCVGPGCSGSGSDSDLQLLAGMLYQYVLADDGG
jgi:hypothetical protein